MAFLKLRNNDMKLSTATSKKIVASSAKRLTSGKARKVFKDVVKETPALTAKDNATKVMDLDLNKVLKPDYDLDVDAIKEKLGGNKHLEEIPYGEIVRLLDNLKIHCLYENVCLELSISPNKGVIVAVSLDQPAFYAVYRKVTPLVRSQAGVFMKNEDDIYEPVKIDEYEKIYPRAGLRRPNKGTVIIDQRVPLLYRCTYKLEVSGKDPIEKSIVYQRTLPTIEEFRVVPSPYAKKVDIAYKVSCANSVEITKVLATVKGSPRETVYEGEENVNGSITDEKVKSGEKYIYRLTAKNAWGESKFNVEVDCSNLEPKKPEIKSIHCHEMRLGTVVSWDQNLHLKYTLIRTCDSRANFDEKIPLDITCMGYYEDFSTSSNKIRKDYMYRYSIQVENGWGTAKSDEVEIVMHNDAPQRTSITRMYNDLDGHVHIFFNKSNKASSYQVVRFLKEAVNKKGKTAEEIEEEMTKGLCFSTDTICYEDTTVSEGNLYEYKVFTSNDWGKSSFSAGREIYAYKEESANVKRKFLAIGCSDDRFANVDCRQMCNAFEHNGIPSKYLMNTTLKDFDKEAKKFFNGFNDSDYPIIFINSHGGDGNMDLFFSKTEDGVYHLINSSYETIKSFFDKIRGHKIVIVDSCYCGSALSSGVFKDPNYSVLCSCEPGEVSKGKANDGVEYSFIVSQWCRGLGWQLDYYDERKNKPCDRSADSNNNRVVTVSELHEYGKNVKISHPMCWPENDYTAIVVY